MDLGTANPQQQTDQRAARQLLHLFCENGFDGSISACALALGRPAEEIGEMLYESTNIDEDLLMKLRGIADERGIDIGST